MCCVDGGSGKTEVGAGGGGWVGGGVEGEEVVWDEGLFVAGWFV